MNGIKVFIASPGDVAEERDITSQIVSEINRMFGERFGIQLEAVRWETHVMPDIGDDAQDVINHQISDFDILIGIMWKRFGSPTKRAKSGTGEEFDKAYRLFKEHGRPKIMFYFRTTPFYPKELTEVSQFRKVIEFKNKLETLGVLYWTYNTPLEYERNVREHLVRQILQFSTKAEAVAKSSSDDIFDEYRESRPTKTKGKTVSKLYDLAPIRPRIADIESCPLFLAYSHRDKDKVREIYNALKGAGYRPWLDEQDLFPGQIWHNEVNRAIQQAKVLLLFLSSSSVNQQGYVAKEFEYALKMQSNSSKPFIIPVRLDQIEPPVNLRQFMWVDFFLPDGLEKLLDATKRACEITKGK